MFYWFNNCIVPVLTIIALPAFYLCESFRQDKISRTFWSGPNVSVDILTGPQVGPSLDCQHSSLIKSWQEPQRQL